MALNDGKQWKYDTMLLPCRMAGISVSPGGEVVMLGESAVFSIDVAKRKVYLVAGHPMASGAGVGGRFESARFSFSSLSKGALHLDAGHLFEDEEPGYPFTLCRPDLDGEQVNKVHGFETRRFEHPILVSDRNNGVIKLLIKEEVVVFAGKVSLSSKKHVKDGPRKEAVFGHPSCITHLHGYFFVSDAHHPRHCIRVIAPSGLVTTIGQSKGMADGSFSHALFNFPYHITPLDEDFILSHPLLFRPTSDKTPLKTSTPPEHQISNSASSSSDFPSDPPPIPSPSSHKQSKRIFSALSTEPMIVIVSDSDNDTMRLFDLHRETVSSFPRPSEQTLNWPRSSFMMPDGTIVICSLGSESIVAIKPNIPSSNPFPPLQNDPNASTDPLTTSPSNNHTSQPTNPHSVFEGTHPVVLANNDYTKRCFDIALHPSLGAAYLAVDNRNELIIINNFCSPFIRHHQTYPQSNLSKLLSLSNQSVFSASLESFEHHKSGTTYFVHSTLLQALRDYLINVPELHHPWKFQPTPWTLLERIPRNEIPFTKNTFIQTLSGSNYPKCTIDMFLEVLHGESLTKISEDMAKISGDANKLAHVQAGVIYLHERCGLPIPLTFMVKFSNQTLPLVTDVDVLVEIILEILTSTSVVWDILTSYLSKQTSDNTEKLLEALRTRECDSELTNSHRKSFLDFFSRHSLSPFQLTIPRAQRDYRSTLHLTIASLAQSINWKDTKSQSTENFCFRVTGHDGYLEVHPWVLYPQWTWFKDMIDSGFSEKQTGECELSEISPGLLLVIIQFLYTHTVPYDQITPLDANFVFSMGGMYRLVDHEGQPLEPFSKLVFAYQLASEDHN